jgi:hypothetical protein
MAAAAEMGCGVKGLAALILFAWALDAATYAVTVAGLGGEPDYAMRFSAWARDLGKLVRGETLTGPDSSRERVRAALRKVAQDAAPEDDFVLTLIGHGTWDGADYRFNLPGPDITAAELAGLLNAIKAGRQLVVNTTSSSGASLEVLKAPGRVVVAATKSGTERLVTVFPRYWVEALRDPAADTDKNESISAAEAFRYASEKTKNFYETQKRLATEHPQLADAEKGLAGRFILARFGSAGAALKDPAKRALLAKKEDLEQQIDKLKYEKAAMPDADYKKRLTTLLLELARTQEELDK